MLVYELIDALQQVPQDLDVLIGDSFYNGDSNVSDYNDPVLYYDASYTLLIVAKDGTQDMVCKSEVRKGILLDIPVP